MLDKNVVKQEAHRSEEVNDIIERMPSGIAKKITFFVVILVACLCLFSYLIKYPDVVRGEMSLSSSASPVKMVCNNAGKLHFVDNVKSQKFVKAGSYIGCIQNAANLDDVRFIDSLLKNIKLNKLSKINMTHYFPENVSLGELNEKYFTFIHSFSSYINHYNIDIYQEQKNILQKQVASQEDIINTSNNDAKLMRSSYALLLIAYSRDSILFSKKVLTLADLERTKIQLLSAQRNFEALKSQTSSIKYQLDDARNKLQQVDIQKLDSKSELAIRMSSSYYALLESIKQWQFKYAFIAPIDGILEFNSFWNQNDYASYGQDLFTIIPRKKDIYAQVFLPENGAGKVHKGQSVILKLNDFPFNEYGSVRGKVKDISLVTNQQVSKTNQKENLYLVKVSLPRDLLTNYGTVLDFRFGGKGIAEIITSDKRLFARLFDNLKYATTNRK